MIDPVKRASDGAFQLQAAGTLKALTGGMQEKRLVRLKDSHDR